MFKSNTQKGEKEYHVFIERLKEIEKELVDHSYGSKEIPKKLLPSLKVGKKSIHKQNIEFSPWLTK